MVIKRAKIWLAIPFEVLANCLHLGSQEAEYIII